MRRTPAAYVSVCRACAECAGPWGRVVSSPGMCAASSRALLGRGIEMAYAAVGWVDMVSYTGKARHHHVLNWAAWQQ
jgi:hypothetical protein